MQIKMKNKYLQYLSIVVMVTALTSCIMPDPYRMEVFDPTDGKYWNTLCTSKKYTPILINEEPLWISIDSSGHYVDEAFPPYRLRLSLDSETSEERNIYIHSVSITFNGSTWSPSLLHDVSSDKTFSIPGKVSSSNEHFRFWLLSDWIDIEHIAGKKLTASIDIESKGPTKSVRRTVSRTFKAKVKKGFFQDDLGPLKR